MSDLDEDMETILHEVVQLKQRCKDLEAASLPIVEWWEDKKVAVIDGEMAYNFDRLAALVRGK